eukprot:scaffold1717_cov21-Tisochrysis_lutea.AAC.10
MCWARFAQNIGGASNPLSTQNMDGDLNQLPVRNIGDAFHQLSMQTFKLGRAYIMVDELCNYEVYTRSCIPVAHFVRLVCLQGCRAHHGGLHCQHCVTASNAMLCAGGTLARLQGTPWRTGPPAMTS